MRPFLRGRRAGNSFLPSFLARLLFSTVRSPSVRPSVPVGRREVASVLRRSERVRTEEGRLPRLPPLRARSFVRYFFLQSGGDRATVFALFVNVDLVAVRGGGDHARLTATGAREDGHGKTISAARMFPSVSGNINASGGGNGHQEQITDAGGEGDSGGVSPTPVDSGAAAMAIVSSGGRVSNASRQAATAMASIAPVTSSTSSQYLSRCVFDQFSSVRYEQLQFTGERDPTRQHYYVILYRVVGHGQAFVDNEMRMRRVQ